MTKINLGDKVQICEGSGLDSGAIGTIISHFEYLQLKGDPNDFLIKRRLTDTVFIKLDKPTYLEAVTMLKSRVIKIS